MNTLLMRGAVLSGPEEIPDSEVECWRCPVNGSLQTKIACSDEESCCT